jgi:hypothetical protein
MWTHAKRTSAINSRRSVFLSHRFASGELRGENVDRLDHLRFGEQVVRFRHQGLGISGRQSHPHWPARHGAAFRTEFDGAV